jgi:hypothetical protein
MSFKVAVGLIRNEIPPEILNEVEAVLPTFEGDDFLLKTFRLDVCSILKISNSF